MDMETAQPSSSRIKRPLAMGFFIFLIIILSAFILYSLFFAKGNKLQLENQTGVDSSIPAPAVVLSPLPSPKPLQGPGPYACDPEGICNIYENAVGAGCPKTYADMNCLEECGDAKVHCPK